MSEHTLKAAAVTLCVLAAAASFIQDARTRASLEAGAQTNEGPMIALTFDDGPYPEVTAAILDALEQYGVKATFFVLGSRVKGQEEMLKRMEELGCEIGNHTWSHADLTGLSAAQCISEIEKTNEEFKRVLGHGAAVVRPPFGHYNSTVRNLVPYPLILWTVDTGVLAEAGPPAACQKRRGAGEGGLRDTHARPANLHRRGDHGHHPPCSCGRAFRFVTISELIEARDGQSAAVKLPP